MGDVLFVWGELERAHNDIWHAIEETGDVNTRLAQLVQQGMPEDMKGNVNAGLQEAHDTLHDALGKVLPALEELHTTIGKIMGNAHEVDQEAGQQMRGSVNL